MTDRASGEGTSDGPAASMRVLLVDDEALVRAALRDVLVHEPGVEIVGEARNGTEALAAVEALRPDVVFLDIRMPGMSGLEVAARLPGEDPPAIVFVTAYDTHAVRAFELDALDYLLKPFDGERVQAALRRARARRRMHAAAHDAAGPGSAVVQRLEAVLDLLAREPAAARADTRAERFVVSLNGRLRVVAAADVEWIEADGNYARLHLTAGTALLRETMKTLEARLDPGEFARVHRSALVRIAAVRELQPTPNGDYTIRLASGALVTMSRSYRDDVLRRLGASP